MANIPQFIRGTTPIFKLEFESVDVDTNNLKYLIVRIGQGCVHHDYTPVLSADGTQYKFAMTQEETLDYKVGSAYAQLMAKETADGEYIAKSSIVPIGVLPTLFNEVM